MVVMIHQLGLYIGISGVAPIGVDASSVRGAFWLGSCSAGEKGIVGDVIGSFESIWL